MRRRPCRYLDGERVMDLDAESEHATELLKGKIVARVVRHRAEEVCVEFADGTRLYVDRSDDGVELSVTSGNEE